uniref:Exonuclease domain-containing protein n=1 Tax=Trichobilharzia regenti TaxID=157069 RepID=A0AA85KL41_TRIRE|nr:unnamed protein product [Trichobilharzia regenti]
MCTDPVDYKGENIVQTNTIDVGVNHFVDIPNVNNSVSQYCCYDNIYPLNQYANGYISNVNDSGLHIPYLNQDIPPSHVICSSSVDLRHINSYPVYTLPSSSSFSLVSPSNFSKKFCIPTTHKTPVSEFPSSSDTYISSSLVSNNLQPNHDFTDGLFYCPASSTNYPITSITSCPLEFPTATFTENNQSTNITQPSSPFVHIYCSPYHQEYSTFEYHGSYFPSVTSSSQHSSISSLNDHSFTVPVDPITQPFFYPVHSNCSYSMDQSTSEPSNYMPDFTTGNGDEVFDNNCYTFHTSFSLFGDETTENSMQHLHQHPVTDLNNVDKNQTDKQLISPSASSSFIESSISDIDLYNLEELLARTSIADAYLGPVRNKDGKFIPLDCESSAIFSNNLTSLPYSSTSLAFSPPGIQIITEMWSIFLRDRLSQCNNRIHNMSMDVLRNCLHDHGLNQLGCGTVLKRRLQEFVRRARVAQSIDHNTEIQFSDDDNDNSGDVENSIDNANHESSVLGEVNLNSQITNTSGNDKIKLKKSPINAMTKLSKPVILTPDTFYSYLLIIDLEATCESREKIISDADYPHEIIEFPILLYNTRLRKCVSVFHAYCKPKLHPDLSEFCTDLTQIHQVQVDNAQPFPHVLLQIEEWLFKQHQLANMRCAIVCDCNADMSKFMRIQCRLANIPLPSWANIWINLTKAFRTFYKFPARYRITLNVMLHDLNLSFVGQRHRGLDDAINILRVVRTLLADGCQLRVNERIDFNKPPSFVSSVPRVVAEVTSGVMGSKLVLLSSSPRKSKLNNGNRNHENQKISSASANLDESHRESFLWLANVQKTRVPRSD